MPRENSTRRPKPTNCGQQTIPEIRPHANLGADYAIMGQFDKALAEQQEALRLAPDNVNIYSGLGATYLYLNQLDEASATFDQALARKLDDGGLRQFMYYLAFLRGDSEQTKQQVAWAAGKPGDEDLLLSIQSDTEAYYGRLSKARELSRRAVDSAVRAGDKETAALWQVDAALREAELGNTACAKEGVTAGCCCLRDGMSKCKGPSRWPALATSPGRRHWSKNWRRATRTTPC